MDFGAFCELEPGLNTLLHSSELNWTKKNPSAKSMFKKGDVIDCVTVSYTHLTLPTNREV